MAYCSAVKTKGFSSKLDCDIAITQVQLRNKRRRKARFNEDPKRSFKCPHCKQWHMTSQDKDPGRSLRTR